MVITKERTAVDRSRVRRRIRYRVIYVAWLFVLLLVFAVQTGTQYLMGDWTKQRLERVMSRNLNKRTVSLGHTTWSLGLNGLILNSNSMTIREADGKPFIVAGATEIGIPLLPLFSGQTLVRHVYFNNPEVYATRLPGGKWNFSDLPSVQSLKKVALIEVNNGRLHLVDQSKPVPGRWANLNIEHIGFRLERPVQGQSWPFALTFQMPQKGYTTTVDLIGIGNGVVDDWSKNQHTFELSARNINVQDFRELWPNLPDIQGLLNVNLRGDGVPEREFRATAAISAPKLQIDAPGFGVTNLDNAQTSGNFVLSAERIQWNDFLLKVPHLTLRSRGAMTRWQERPTYDFQVTATSDDLYSVSQLIPAQILPRELLRTSDAIRIARERRKIVSVRQALYPARLTGSGSIVARVTGAGKSPTIAAEIKAQNIRTSELAELKPFQQFPILKLLTANRESRLSTHMNLHPNGSLNIRSGEFKLKGSSTVTFRGFINGQSRHLRLSFSSRGLNLAHVSEALGTPENRAMLNRMLGFPSGSRIALGGIAQLSGSVESKGTDQNIQAVSTLRNVRIELNNGQVKATNIYGTIVGRGDYLSLENIRGRIGGGNFRMDGTVPVDGNQNIAITYTADSMNVDALKSLVRAFNQPNEFLENRTLRGRLVDINMNIRGNMKSPNVLASGSPRDFTFVPPGSLAAITLNGGRIIFDNHGLYFENIAGRLGRGEFTMVGRVSNANTNLILIGKNIDIREFKSAVLGLNVKAPILRDQTVFGTVRHADLRIVSRGGQTSFSLVTTPLDLYYQPRGFPKTIVLTGGTVRLNNQSVSLNRVVGNLGTGSFEVNGNWRFNPSAGNVSFYGKNLDLSHVKTTLLSLGVKSPLLAQQLLYGKVKNISMSVKGSAQKPDIQMVARPQDIYFEPYGSSRKIHLRGGTVSYVADRLTVKDINIVSARSKGFLHALRIDNLSSKSRLMELKLTSKDFDLSDIHSYLAADKTPPAVRTKYLDLLSSYGLANPRGTLSGTIDYKVLPKPENGKEFDFSGNVAFSDLAAELRGFPFHDITGKVVVDNEDLVFDNVKGKLGQTEFDLLARIKDFRTANRVWEGEAHALLNVRDFIALIPDKSGRLKQLINIEGNVPVKVAIAGNPTRTALTIHGEVAPDTEVSFEAPIGTIHKPAGQAISVDASMIFQPGPPAVLEVDHGTLAVGETALAMKGRYVWSNGDVRTEPVIDFSIALNNPVQARTLLSLLPLPAFAGALQGVTGTIGGEITLTGPLSSPATRGELRLFNIAIPQYGLTGITGTIEAPDWFAPRQPGRVAELTGIRSEAKLNIRDLTLGNITLHNIKGTIVSEETAGGPKLTLDDATVCLYGGTVKLNGTIVMSDRKPFSLNITASNIDVNKAATEAFNVKDEITGRLNATASVDGYVGRNMNETLAALDGNGSVTIANGRVKRFGQLEKGLSALSILKQGILGFNLNDLLSVIAPKKSGRFQCLIAQFDLHNGVLDLERFAFQGEQLRLRGVGTVNLISKDLRVEVVGNMPRKSLEEMDSPIDLLTNLSIARVLDIVTNKAFRIFPDLPLIGGPASDDPRTFMFTLAGNLNNPDSFTESVLDTFKWLPTHPRASPYPMLSARDSPLLEPDL